MAEEKTSYRLMFWMNVIICMLCYSLSFKNIDYVEYSFANKLISFCILVVFILTALVFYLGKNGLVCSTALVLNVLLAGAYAVSLLRIIYRWGWDNTIVQIILLTSLLLNAVQLNKLRSIKLCRLTLNKNQ